MSTIIPWAAFPQESVHMLASLKFLGLTTRWLADPLGMWETVPENCPYQFWGDGATVHCKSTPLTSFLTETGKPSES